MNASTEVATTAAMPTAASRPQAKMPSELPTVVRRAAARPPRAALRTTIAVAAPGGCVSPSATGRNVSHVASMGLCCNSRA